MAKPKIAGGLTAVSVPPPSRPVKENGAVAVQDETQEDSRCPNSEYAIAVSARTYFAWIRARFWPDEESSGFFWPERPKYYYSSYKVHETYEADRTSATLEVYDGQVIFEYEEFGEPDLYEGKDEYGPPEGPTEWDKAWICTIKVLPLTAGLSLVITSTCARANSPAGREYLAMLKESRRLFAPVALDGKQVPALFAESIQPLAAEIERQSPKDAQAVPVESEPAQPRVANAPNDTSQAQESWQQIADSQDREIARRWCRGDAAGEIGKALSLAPKTISNRVTELRKIYPEALPRRRGTPQESG